MNRREFIFAAGSPLLAGATPAEIRHLAVYKQPGRYGGWPANHGIWSWGNEIVVGFEAGYFKQGLSMHTIDYDRPAEHLLARSKDGGESWTIEKPASLRPPPGIKQAGVPVETGDKPAVPCPGGIPFTHPDFCMAWRMADIHVGPSRFTYSTDRGRNWSGPFQVPDFGTPGIAARTDYLVTGPASCLVFLTAAKTDRREGRVLCARTGDEGKSWQFAGWVTPEPKGFAIMPSSVRVNGDAILTAVRVKDPSGDWIDLYRSTDEGRTWSYVSRPAPRTGSNPPSMLLLKDGRLCVTYGCRIDPYGIRARISADLGKTWGDELILRDDGGGRDLGYPRTVQRPDGKLVTVYYFNDKTGPDRYIGATIWAPPK